MANTYITHTPSNGGTPGTQKFTLSFWIKRSKLSSTQRFLGAYTSGNLNTNATFNSNDTFQFYNRNTSAGDKYFVTNRKFRDTNAWYHFVIAIDTTLSTEANRVKFYLNGVEETSFSEVYEPPQNYEYRWGEALAMNIGQPGTNADYFDGSISHFHYIDGTQYSASDFGETDSTTGEWKIKTDVSVTYGNDGYFILKDGNSVTDQSGNGNNFTVGGGTLTKTEDSPSNVFATLNPLSTKAILSHGNTESEHDGSATGYLSSVTTLGMTSGKYYCECKLTVTTGYPGIGIASTDSVVAQNKFSDSYIGESSDSYGYYTPNGYLYNSGNATTGLTTFATNDIIAMALDLDSTQNTLKYYKNGTLVYTVNIPDNSSGWFFASVHTNSQTSARAKFNFGNGYFRSDAVSSAGTNASGNGIFEYDVPTGYTALSTKGLNL